MEVMKMEAADDSGVSGNGYGSSGSSPAGAVSPETINSPSSGNDTMASPIPSLSPTHEFPDYKNMYSNDESTLQVTFDNSHFVNKTKFYQHPNGFEESAVTKNKFYQHPNGSYECEVTKSNNKKKEKSHPVKFITFKSNNLIEMNCPLIHCLLRNEIFYVVQTFSEHILTHCELGILEDDRPKVLARIIHSIEQIVEKKTNKRKKAKSPVDQEFTIDDVPLWSPEPNRDDEMRIDSHVPQISKGTIRVLPCKTCQSEIFLCKAVFWTHLADVHLKNEKMFKCDRCAFVTQYRHHNEYHNIKHQGLKPLKCKYDNCDYHCENQAMLVSHHKSHLQFATFFCGSCNYKSKYITPYKHHLVDRNHLAGYALNDDGSLIDGFTIDPHSTKRGPKTKKLKIEKLEDQIVPFDGSSFNQQVENVMTLQKEFMEKLFNPLDLSHKQAMYNYLLYKQSVEEEVSPKMKKVTKKPKTNVCTEYTDPLDLTVKKSNLDGPIDLCKPSTSGTYNKRKGNNPVKCTSQRQFDSEEEEAAAPVLEEVELYKCPWNSHGCTAVFGSAEFTQQHYSCHGLENPLVCMKCNAITISFQQFCDHLALKGIDH